MYRTPRLFACLFALAGAAFAAGATANPVSPAAAPGERFVAASCATFSWSPAPGAEGHEIAVWSSAEEDTGGRSTERLRFRIVVDGAASSFTPSRERCLAPAGRYAWSVRALVDGAWLDWADPATFEVGGAPTDDDVAAAVDVLRRHFATIGEAGEGGRRAAPAAPEPARVRARREPFTAPAGAASGTAEAVRGEAVDIAGDAFGVSGLTNSPAGGGVRAENLAGGPDLVLAGATPLSLSEGGLDRAAASDQTFTMSNSGAGVLGLTVEGSVSAASFTGAGGGLTGVDAATLDGVDSADFAPAAHGHFGQLFSGSSDNFGLRVNNAGANAAIIAFQSSTSALNSGAVRGESASVGGIGLLGIASDPTSLATGVKGEAFAASGIGVEGNATGTGGFAVGIKGRSSSASGAGGFFVNTGGGNLIAANNTNASTNLEFRVDSAGNVFADGVYHCGASLDDGLGDLSEVELDPCVRDGSPADFAELFPAAERDLGAGEVVALGVDGLLRRTRRPNDPKAVGVISTRPSYLGNARYAGRPGWAALALSGVVPVRVTAEGGAIAPGDWLVASSTPGHAMRCASLSACAGRTVGKALDAHANGDGKVRMLVIAR